LRGAVLRIALLLATGLPAWPIPAATYELAHGAFTQVVGEDVLITARYTDTLYDLAESYGVGSEEIIRANPEVDPWLPGSGTQVLVPGRLILPPGPREGIVINIAEHRLYYYPKPLRHRPPVVITYPVSIGSMDWKTPLGATRIIQKVSHPTWHPPLSIREEHKKNGDPLPAAVPPGPRNPLGAFALRLNITPGDYLIHGTNNPLAVGMPVTHGCIRLYPKDIAALFAMVPVGTKVYLLNDPVKVAAVDGELLLEAHPPVDAEGQSVKPQLSELQQRLEKALGGTPVTIDWERARESLELASGVPVGVGQADTTSAAARSGPSRRARGRLQARRHAQEHGSRAPTS
jgi:L,D-transpeptidase ErfK/SrfK